MSDIVTGIPDERVEDPTSVKQYALQTLGRLPVINGDQEWVKDGRGAKAQPLHTLTLVRDISITYGPWRLHDPNGGGQR